MTVPDVGAEELIDGPLVRPYTMTRGRARPASGRFDLIALVVATRGVPPPDAAVGPEHIQILQLCRQPYSVAEVAAHLDLPLGTIRVLLGDLLVRQLVEVRHPQRATAQPNDKLLKAVLDGLRAL